MSERGKFIVFEGIGGCGKGTQVGLTRSWLEGLGKKVLVTCEHTRDTPTGILIERIIKKQEQPIDPLALQLLFVVDRANHTRRVIMPALEEHDVVIGDRYYPSTVAYTEGEMRGMMLGVNRAVSVRPDLVLLIDVDSQLAAERVGLRGDADIFDQKERLENCRRGYEWYAKNSSDEVAWIDGGGAPDEVHARIISEINRRGIL